jgi:hypothetical protein
VETLLPVKGSCLVSNCTYSQHSTGPNSK